MPPWDIGRPQRAFVELEEQGLIAGSVLDVGCGTGENALFLAEAGHNVVGLDGSPTAIDRARDRADARKLEVDFRVGDALDASSLGTTFDTAIDCGLFHTFSDELRPSYAAAMHAALNPGGNLFILCFSDLQPGTQGPRRVSEAEIRMTFSDGWHVESINASVFETEPTGEDIRAWLAQVKRNAEP